MPLPSEMERRITAIVAARCKQPLETFDRDARFREDLGRDSLDLFELLFTLEEELGISIPDADAMELRTLTGVLAYLDRHMEVGRLDAPVR